MRMVLLLQGAELAVGKRGNRLSLEHSLPHFQLILQNLLLLSIEVSDLLESTAGGQAPSRDSGAKL